MLSNLYFEFFMQVDSLEGCTDEKLVARLSERKQLSSVSTALLLAVGIGLIEALALYFGSGVFLNIMGISSVSEIGSQFMSCFDLLIYIYVNVSICYLTYVIDILLEPIR